MKRVRDVTYDPILSPREAAKYLGIGLTTLWKLHLPQVRRGIGVGRPRKGYLLSVLNAYKETLYLAAKVG